MPIRWLSKQQKTVETSSYGLELVAIQMAIELIIDLRYTLRMLGVPVNKPTLMPGDNMSVILNRTVPSSQLKIKNLMQLPIIVSVKPSLAILSLMSTFPAKTTWLTFSTNLYLMPNFLALSGIYCSGNHYSVCLMNPEWRVWIHQM
jgi:hypothetical protein